ncbi:unnamed protein product [Hydatigera taeniaeformis]|uniref:Uncharacterized protein n=1 Tax=Hydatigena taeniaeformis TaxID=6205 RepID=A0A0R3X5X4_HYDTA|nr:unnamed protein product [Hydatigera taeniaeformis]
MSNNLHEFQNYDSSFYGDAIEELSAEKLKGYTVSDLTLRALTLCRFKRPSSYIECVKTEQGDHQISIVDDALTEKRLDESITLSNNLQSFSSSNLSDINSTVVEGEDELTVVASIASRSEECSHPCSSNRTSNDEETELGVTELVEALQHLSRDARFRSIRPLWRDPNSRLLPSDETASVEAMLREYNNLLLTAATTPNVSSSLNSQLAVRRPYHSTLNRWRQQERIQVENFILANRLRNIRPSPETSREALLKHYREYFITPVTAQCLTKMPTLDSDSSLPRCRPRCSSARSTQIGASRPLKSFNSSISSRATPAPPRASACGCTSTSRGSIVETPRSREVLKSLNSVRRALHEQRVKGKL